MTPRRRGIVRTLVAGAWLAAAPGFAPARAQVTDATFRTRFGFSARTMGDASRNDVTAAMKVWIQTISRDRGIPADPNPIIFDSFDSVLGAMQRKELEVINLPTDEHLQLATTVGLTGLFAVVMSGRVTEEYMVVVRANDPAQRLADLRGRRIVILDHPRTTLSRTWLDVVLLRERLPTAPSFFDEITHQTKVNRAVLPVYFGQADACLVTRRNLDAVGELNPDVKRKLRVLAQSPAIVPAVGSYRADVPERLIGDYRRETLNLSHSPAGRHVLNMFQCDDLVQLSESELVATRALLSEYETLRRGNPATTRAP